MGVAVVMVEKRPSGAEKEPRRGDLSPDRGGRGRAAASLEIIPRCITHYCILSTLKNFEKHSYPLCQVPPPRDLKAGSVQRTISLQR